LNKLWLIDYSGSRWANTGTCRSEGREMGRWGWMNLVTPWKTPPTSNRGIGWWWLMMVDDKM
jgi:hypothetical protein